MPLYHYKIVGKRDWKDMEQRKSMGSSMMMLLTAFIFGIAFVAQSDGMNYVGGFTFVGCRYLLAGAVLIPVIAIFRRKDRNRLRAMSSQDYVAYNRNSLVGGICCGFCLFVGTSLQQFGVAYTTVANAGFITSLYIVMVPLAGLIFLHKKVEKKIWIGVALALAGMYLLCIKEGFTVSKGDLLVLLCAAGFTLHILTIDYFAPKADGVLMSCIQFFTTGLLGCMAMFILEQPSWNGIFGAWISIVFAGVVSGGIGYTMQIVAQKNLDSAIASLIQSLESVFSLLAGWVLLGQKLSAKELSGCGLVLGAIILVQIPWGNQKRQQYPVTVAKKGELWDNGV